MAKGKLLSPESLRRTGAVVRIVERQQLGGLRAPTKSPDLSTPFWLAKANELILAGNVGEFTALKPGGAKGAEEELTDVLLDAYVRRGLCFEEGIYLLIGTCPGEDATFDILDPTTAFLAIADEGIAEGTGGNVRIGEEPDVELISVSARFGAIPEGAFVWCAWDDLSGGFFGIQIPCSTTTTTTEPPP